MAERKRLNGFGLMDAAFAADAKFVRLARLAPTPTDFAAAVGVFWLILADCRRARSPEVKWDDYDEYADQTALLRKAKLLVEQGFDLTTFGKWAPAYQSPAERGVQTGTEGYGEVQAGTVHRLGYANTQSTSENGGVVGGDDPERDPMTVICRLVGYWPQKDPKEYAAAVDDVTHRYGLEWTLEAIGPAYALLSAKGRVRHWDMKRQLDLILGERSRSEEQAVKAADRERARAETEKIKQARNAMTPEQRQTNDLMKQAVALWLQNGKVGTVPTDTADLPAWLAEHA